MAGSLLQMVQNSDYVRRGSLKWLSGHCAWGALLGGCLLTFAVIGLSVPAVQAQTVTSPSGLVDATYGQTARNGKFVLRSIKDEQGTHQYVVFVPAGYRKGRPTPAILFLHGAGERGTDHLQPIRVGLGPYVRARAATFPALVIFPQAEDRDSQALAAWQANAPDGRRALAILDDVETHYSVDPKKISLVGWSMGGYGAWALAAAAPDRFSGVLSLSGGGDPAQLVDQKLPPVWAIHGEQDALVPIEPHRQLATAVREAGGKVTFTALPAVGHDVFAPVFGCEEPFLWLMNPTQAPPKLGRTSVVLRPAPFRPDVTMPGAIGLRLGNDTLQTMSYALAREIPASMLQGGLADMFDSTTASGRSFSVRFSGLRYSARLERVQVETVANNRIRVQLGIRNAVLTIGGTSITGARHAAQAGPINIVIGQSRPVWMVLDLTPTVQQQRLRFLLNGASFSIPADNWSVSPPAGISVQGFGMTQERVQSSLMSGLYGQRGRIEGQVTSIAPTIVRQLEESLNVTDLGPYLQGLWPLPAFAPRLRAYPEAVRADANGVSLVMGLQAAAPLDTLRPAKPRVAQVGNIGLDEIPADRTLRLVLAPQILTPLTKLISDSHAAHVNVLDIPNPQFVELGNRAVLQELIPALANLPETARVRSVFEMASPLEVDLAATSGDALGLKLPEAIMTVSSQETEDAPWRVQARWTVQLDDRLAMALRKGVGGKPRLQLAWSEEPTVGLVRSEVASAELATENGLVPGTPETLHDEEFLKRFTQAWKGWSRQSVAATTQVPDVELGLTRLRVSDVSTRNGRVSAAFSVPKIRITNSTQSTLRYQVRGAFSNYGATQELPPGRSHEYAVPYGITYRYELGGQWKSYRLPAGGEIEYRVPKAGGSPRMFQARPEVIEQTPASAIEDRTTTVIAEMLAR